jgi:hypothetical protein
VDASTLQSSNAGLNNMPKPPQARLATDAVLRRMLATPHQPLGVVKARYRAGRLELIKVVLP